jgi:hypothetical protein
MTVYINRGRVRCLENNKIYENVKMMDIGEDHHGSLIWCEDLKRWCRWEPIEINEGKQEN